jgi:hypothetical protein
VIVKTIYWAWVKGVRMSEERYARLTDEDYQFMSKFWAGCCSKEEEEKFKKEFPDATQWSKSDQ